MVRTILRSLLFFSFSPDGQLFEGQEEEQMDRELPAEIFRRQLINNLAKHVLFSKKNTTSQSADGLHSQGDPLALTVL